MQIIAPTTPAASFVGGRIEPAIAVGGVPTTAPATTGSLPPTSDAGCDACCRREELLMSIERRSEQQRVIDRHVLAQMAATFAATRP